MFLSEAELPPCARSDLIKRTEIGSSSFCTHLFRLSSQITEEDALKISAKESASLEDQHLAEALARYHFDNIQSKISKNPLVPLVGAC
jgi:hypothetical protein